MRAYLVFAEPPNISRYVEIKGGFQDYGPFLGTLNIRCRIRVGIQKGSIILITTHIGFLQGHDTCPFEEGSETKVLGIRKPYSWLYIYIYKYKYMVVI